MDNNYNNYNFITASDRAEVIANELGDRVTIEPYDDGYCRVLFNNVTNLDLLLLFHAGVKVGHNELANVLV